MFICMGLAKKVLLANSCGKVADMVSQMMKLGKKKHLKKAGFLKFDTTKFRRSGMYTIW